MALIRDLIAWTWAKPEEPGAVGGGGNADTQLVFADIDALPEISDLGRCVQFVGDHPVLVREIEYCEVGRTIRCVSHPNGFLVLNV